MTIQLTDATTSGLGLTGLTMTTREQAEQSLTAIDAAINRVSSERARMGSYYNRLEHVYENASNYKENLIQAESTLRDADMPAEISNLQAKQVLLQSAQAMGAQVNQQLQGILQLLQ